MVSSTARAAAAATGLPPKVVPWLPGWSRSAASPVAMHAPIGKPPARPLATVTMSATPSIGAATAGLWWAYQAPVRPMPVWISSSHSSAPCSAVISRACAR